jgi:integrase/recombinase XerD
MPKLNTQFPVVKVLSRHSAGCHRADDKTYTRCQCPKRLEWRQDGQRRRVSAGTSDVNVATHKAAEMTEQFRRAALNLPEPEIHHNKVSVTQAVSQFLATKGQEVGGRHSDKLTQIFQRDFLPWCTKQGILFITNVKLADIERWRTTWDGASTTNRKKQGRVIGFFDWCLAHDLIKANPLGLKGARKIAEIKLRREDVKSTLPLTDEQFEQLLKAIPLMNGRTTPEERTRVRGLVLLMRWSGLAIQDAVTLGRACLVKQEDGWYLLSTDRRKTGVEVQVSIAPKIGDELLAIPNSNPEFFFSNGETSETDVSKLTHKWGNLLNYRLDKAAVLKNERGDRVNFHSHMLRDTFAVWCFLQDMSTEDVAALLGHKDIAITQKHYSPWVDSRRKRLSGRVKDAFKRWDTPPA